MLAALASREIALLDFAAANHLNDLDAFDQHVASEGLGFDTSAPAILLRRYELAAWRIFRWAEDELKYKRKRILMGIDAAFQPSSNSFVPLAPEPEPSREPEPAHAHAGTHADAEVPILTYGITGYLARAAATPGPLVSAPDRLTLAQPPRPACVEGSKSLNEGGVVRLETRAISSSDSEIAPEVGVPPGAVLRAPVDVPRASGAAGSARSRRYTRGHPRRHRHPCIEDRSFRETNRMTENERSWAPSVGCPPSPPGPYRRPPRRPPGRKPALARRAKRTHWSSRVDDVHHCSIARASLREGDRLSGGGLDAGRHVAGRWLRGPGRARAARP